MMVERIAVLLNPSAGRGKAKRNMQSLENSLRYNGLAYDISESRSLNHLIQLTAEKSKAYKVIIGVGGDGTFDIIINELMKQGNRNTFGMVGLGSQNDIVREFEVDSLDKACSAIKAGKTMQVDLGTITADNPPTSYFLGTASLGLGTSVNKYVEKLMQSHRKIARPELINLIGLMGVYNSFLTKQVPIPLELYESGKNIPVLGNFSLIVFNNTSFYADGIRLNPAAKPHDGLIDCFCIETDSFLKSLYFYCLANIGISIQGPEVKTMQSSKFRILSKTGVDIQTDGEIRGPYNEINLSVKPKALRLIVSPNYVIK